VAGAALCRIYLEKGWWRGARDLLTPMYQQISRYLVSNRGIVKSSDTRTVMIAFYLCE
jgi:hypothetical protein